MNRLDDARTRLFNALRPLLPDGRMSKYVPAQVVAPCGWIESAQVQSGTVGNSAQVVIATLPVVFVVDGSQQAQTLGTDTLTATVWDAIEALADFTPTDAIPTTLDVGGPTTRAVTVNATITIRGRGLCLPEGSTP